VDQKGVKAAAVTGVMLGTAAARPDEQRVEYVVTLNKPFVYGIIDLVTNTPIFLDVQRNPAAQ
jgi:serine protease inhibitor